MLQVSLALAHCTDYSMGPSSTKTTAVALPVTRANHLLVVCHLVNAVVTKIYCTWHDGNAKHVPFANTSAFFKGFSLPDLAWLHHRFWRNYTNSVDTTLVTLENLLLPAMWVVFHFYACNKTQWTQESCCFLLATSHLSPCFLWAIYGSTDSASQTQICMIPHSKQKKCMAPR